MSTKTTKYEFVKPALTDAADITSTNENWDKLDAMFAGGIVLIEGLDYGEEFPTDPPVGKLFFLKNKKVSS